MSHHLACKLPIFDFSLKTLLPPSNINLTTMPKDLKKSFYIISSTNMIYSFEQKAFDQVK